VLTTPLLAELATRGPVHVVATPGGAPLLARNPDVAGVTIYDKRGSARGVGGLADVAAELSQARSRAAANGATDAVAYLAQGSVRSAALARLAGFRSRVGFTTSAGRWLYTRRVPYRDDRHHAERLWGLSAERPDATPTREQLRPRLFPGGAEREAVDRLLAEGAAERSAGGPLVALAPGSVWATKRWPYYAELARRLAPARERRGHRRKGRRGAGHGNTRGQRRSWCRRDRATLVVRLRGAHSPLCASSSPTTRLRSTSRPPWERRRSRCSVRPSQNLGFGPLAPRSTTAGVVGLECRPCDRHGPMQCPLGHWRCMRDLAVADIAALVAAVESGSR
jgi:heptosyltransferase-2